MSLSLWIPADLQFGEFALGEARPGATRQAVAQAIKRHLFQDTESYDLRLMSVDTADGLLNEGRNLVIVAVVGTALHIRIFDANGQRVVDKAENELINGDTVTNLKRRLDPLPDESRLSQKHKQNFIRDATSVAGHTRFTYTRMLKEFWELLCEPLSTGTRSSARELWSVLLPSDEVTATAAIPAESQTPAAETVSEPELETEHDHRKIDNAGEDEPEPVPERVEIVFCCAVQGLCSSLALRWTGMLDEATDDGEDEEKDEGENAVGPDEETSATFKVERSQALTAIAQLVRPAVQDWMRDHPADAATQAEDLHLASKALLDALLAVSSDGFAEVTGEVVNRGGKPYTPKWIEVRSPTLTQRIEALLKELPFRFTVQPLKEPVAYRSDDRGPSGVKERDYFQVDLIGYRRTNTFLRDLHKGFQRPQNRAPTFERYVQAINLQQAVPWRINQPLLQWARRLCALARDPDQAEAACPGLHEWVLENFYQPAKTAQRKAVERPGEFLDNPLAARALAELCPVEGTPPTFYLVWKADYRGRIYAETPWLTPQGADVQRAVLEFARGRPLDEQGVRALRRHGANLLKRSRLLADLSIAGRQVVTLAERERWVPEHEREILASAASPLTEPFWREVASKPMQFLAFCLAYRQWKGGPEIPIHLPVQIDGTCNGLQHIAALTGDEDLARSVNVLPQQNGLPGDIYSELAKAAAESLGSLASESDEEHGLGLQLADRWLAESPARRGWINRDTAKKVVMTIPYGASQGAQAHYVLEAIAADFEREYQEAPSGMLDRLVTWKEKKENGKDKQPRRIFVAKCCRGLFEKQYKSAFSLKDETARALWDRKRTLAAYVARAIVKHLRTGLSARYPSVDKFSNWLKRTAEACAGLPLVWLTPLGLPVCQDKFQLQGTSVSARIGPRDVRIDVQRLTDTVAARGQKDALLPNLIHSLDATHLAMTFLAAAGRGVTDIGSIHDCLLCHPNDAAALGEVVRQTFARLYGRDSQDIAKPLAEWWNWMDLIVRLKHVKHVDGVLGALEKPCGIGEHLFRSLPRHNDEDKLAQQHSLDVLDAVRRSDDPSRRFFATELLKYLQNHPVKARKQPKNKPAKPPQAPPPPTKRILAITAGSNLSDYFFS